MNKIKLDDVKRIKYVLESLSSISRNINSIDCRCCNGYSSKLQEKRDDNKRVTLLQKGNELAYSIGLKFYHQGDPRGCSVYLIDDTMNNSNYNQGIAF